MPSETGRAQPEPPAGAEPIADALVLTLPPESGPIEWARTGRLPREAQLLTELARWYPRVVVATHEARGQDQISEALSEEVGQKVTVLGLGSGVSDDNYHTRVGAGETLADALNGCWRVVVQTYELGDGGLASEVLPVLAKRQIAASLVARGGCVRSQVLAHKIGPHAAQTIAAGDEERRLCDRASVVVVSNDKMAGDLSWRYGIDPSRITQIPNFVSPVEAPIGVADRDERLVVSWGPLVASQRCDVLIDALATQPDEMRESMTLELIGDGPERESLASRAEAAGVNLRLPGEMPWPDVVDRMSACAVYMHAAMHNPEPIGVQQAMATGAAVVVAEGPGVADAVESGVSGVRVPGSADSFAYALSGILPDRDWRDMLGSCANRRVMRRCSLTAVAERLAEVHRAAAAAATLGTALGAGPARIAS